MEHSTDIWGAFFKTGGVLLFVIASLLFLLYLLKKFSHLKIIKSRHGKIKVLEIHHFSPREKVVLMEVMNKTILLGITPQSIQSLATFDIDVVQNIHQINTNKNFTTFDNNITNTPTPIKIDKENS